MAASCETCRAPGACCKGFVLNKPFDVAHWREEASQFMEEKQLPFVPVRLHESSLGKSRVFGSCYVRFDCTKVDRHGRCSIYENRPELCRLYEPGSDALCAEFVSTFRGIPITVA